QAPDAAEIVRAQHLLQPVGLDLREAGPARDAGVVHEQVDLRMPPGNGLGKSFHLVALRDVAELVLGSELLGERPQPILATRHQDKLPPVLRELAADRLADPARGSGDNGYRQTRTFLAAATSRPPASVATARRTCGPVGTSLVPHELVYTRSAPLRSTPICFPSAKKRTERIGRVELAVTTSAAVFATHRLAAGRTHVSAGPDTPLIVKSLKAVFGRISSLTELMFFPSW